MIPLEGVRDHFSEQGVPSSIQMNAIREERMARRHAGAIRKDPESIHIGEPALCGGGLERRRDLAAIVEHGRVGTRQGAQDNHLARAELRHLREKGRKMRSERLDIHEGVTERRIEQPADETGGVPAQTRSQR
jgi:hypothetical protein